MNKRRILARIPILTRLPILTRFGILTGSIILAAIFVFGPGCSEDPVPPPKPPATQIPTSGLVAFYPFNGDADDASGNDNHGTLLGDSIKVSTFLTIGNDATDRMTLPYTVFEGMGDFTISVWGRIKILHGAPGANVIASGAKASQTNMLLWYFYTATDEWELTINGTASRFGPTATMGDMGWHHVAVLRNGSIGRMYVDGTEIGDGLTVPDVAIDLDPGGLLLGQDQDSVGSGFEARQSWAGDLDNLRIYNRALSAAEIRALSQEAR